MNLQFFERGVWHALENLHLDQQGKPDRKKGAFYDIERVYHIIPKDGSLVLEVKKQKAESAAKAAARKAAKEAQAAASAAAAEQLSKRGEVKFKVGDRVVTSFIHDGIATEFAGEVKGRDDYGRYMVEFDDGETHQVAGSNLSMEE